MKFILEIWPDAVGWAEIENPTPKNLALYAIASVRDHGEELAWEIQEDDGSVIAEGVIPAMTSDAQSKFEALPDDQKVELVGEVFQVLEFNDDRPGVEWNSDTSQALGELFERYGVKFTEVG